MTSGGNFLSINSSTGIVNFTLNQTYAGIWEFNISVNDSSGKYDFFIWKLTVYDYPKISFPASNFEFNIIENISSELNFSANHTIGIILNDTLNYTLYVNNFYRNSTLWDGNGTNLIWNFTANFTDETTCLTNGITTLTLNVSNSKLSNSTSWNITINHTNYPLTFSNNISNTVLNSLTLSDYFTDIDASDTCYNQTIGFEYSLVNASASGGAITVTLTNWTNSSNPFVNFSSTATGSANYSITAYEYTNSSYNSSILRNVTSNNFSVELSVTVVTTTVPSTGGGGGGGSTKLTPISLKIIVPDPVSAKRKDRLVLPLAAINSGKIDLNGIILTSFVAKNGILRDDLIASFDKSFIKTLKAGERENLTMIVDINTKEFGLYEVTINATVQSPVYNDWAKFYINVEESENIEERIIFTEEFIIGNPECAELKELVDEAKALFSNGNVDEAKNQIEEVLESCRQAIEQKPLVKVKKRIEEFVFNYVGLASIILFFLGFTYYSYRRIKLRREGMQTQKKLKTMAEEYGQKLKNN